MTTLQYLKYCYQWERHNKGRIQSAWLAVREAFRNTPF